MTMMLRRGSFTNVILIELPVMSFNEGSYAELFEISRLVNLWVVMNKDISVLVM